MYSVSLLPNEYRMLHKQTRKKEYTIIFSATFVVVLLLTYLLLSLLLHTKTTEFEMIKQENARLESSISKLEEMETLKEEVIALLGQATLASGANPRWHDTLNIIGNSVPDTVGITSMNINYSDEYSEVIIHGTTNNHMYVSDWLRKLEELTVISETKFNFSSIAEGEGIMHFELTLRIPSVLNQIGGESI